MTRNPKPWRMALPALAFLVFAAGWSGFWYWSFTQAQAHITDWRAGLAAKGINITCENESWSGYPFRVEVRCSPGLVEKDGESVSFGKLTVMAQAYNLGHVLAVNDADTVFTSRNGQYRFTHEGAIASLILSRHGHAQADLEFTNLQAEGFLAQSVGLHARTRGQVMELAFSLEGGKAQTQSFSASLTGALQPVPEGMSLQAIAEAGSTFMIDQAVLALGPAQFTGSGTARVLADGTPEGRLGGRITNLQGLLDALFDQDLLAAEERQAAGLLLGLMGAGNPEGMKIDLLASEGWAWIGPVRISPLLPLF